MGTIFRSDNSGAFAVVVGMIALVMFGVLVTLLMDGTVSFSRDSDIRGALETQRVELADLRKRTKDRLEQKAENARLHAVAAKVAEVRGEIRTAREVLDELRQVVEDEEGSLQKLAGEFDDYQDRYRAIVRRKASGEVLGDVSTLKGKVYRNARISVLTPTEMRILHEGGPATIPVTELTPELRERYHLDLAEAVRLVRERKEKALARQQALREKRERERKAEEERIAREDAARRRTGRSGRAPLSKEDEARLLVLRNEVNLMYVNMQALQRRLATARAHVGGPDRSPPGSLQTWEQRVAQLTRQEAVARAAIQAKEDEIRKLDPDYRRPAPPGRRSN